MTPSTTPDLADHGLPDQTMGQHWGEILRIAGHLGECREKLQPALANGDVAPIRASIMRALGPTFVPSDATIHSAMSLVGRWPRLFDKRLRPTTLRMASLLSRVDRPAVRALKIGLAAVVVAVMLTIGVHFLRIHNYEQWKKDVSNLTDSAANMQQQVNTTVQIASGIGLVPLGASVHAEGALVEINKLNNALRQLLVTSRDPEALRAAYAQNSDGRSVVEHDTQITEFARQHLEAARHELALAQEVRKYGEKWHAINAPVTLPETLMPQWVALVAQMNRALTAGDIGAIEHLDGKLEAIKTGGNLEQEAKAIVDGLPEADRVSAQPWLSAISEAVARGDLEAIKLPLDQLRAMHQQLPLSYSIYLHSMPGEKSFVTRPPEHAGAATRYYLIVKATDDNGGPVDVPYYDAELHAVTAAARFGVEVSAETYATVQTRHQLDDRLILIGHKVAGTAIPAMAMTVLDGRISHW